MEFAQKPHTDYGTVLVAELSGVTTLASQRGYEYAFGAVRDCLSYVTEAAQQQRGSVDDGFAEWLLTTFGITRAVADAPRAALYAALAMRRLVGGYARRSFLPIGFGLRIGVDSGPVVCGDMGAPGAPEIAVMGEAVRGATALKTLAPCGRIYVDPDTYLATRDAFLFCDTEGPASRERSGWLPPRELVARETPRSNGGDKAGNRTAAIENADPFVCIHSPWLLTSSPLSPVFSAAFLSSQVPLGELACLAHERRSALAPLLWTQQAGGRCDGERALDGRAMFFPGEG